MSGGFAAGNGTVVSRGGDQWESFKGKGETLGGRKTKGKGISHRKVEQVPEGSKIIRTECVSLSSSLLPAMLIQHQPTSHRVEYHDRVR
jgi:hypothetical protein